MADYEFSMPWPPSVNVWKTPFRNRMILTRKGRQYRIDAVERIKELGMHKEGISGSVSVSMVLNPPTLRRYDIDNFCKSLFDALTISGFWVDDEQIHKLTIEKGEKVKGGSVDIKINIINW